MWRGRGRQLVLRCSVIALGNANHFPKKLDFLVEIALWYHSRMAAVVPAVPGELKRSSEDNGEATSPGQTLKIATLGPS